MKNYRLSFLIKPLSYIIDIIVMNISICLGYYLKFNSIESLFNYPYSVLFWIFNVSWLAIISLSKSYQDSRVYFNVPNLLVGYFRSIFFLIAIISIFWVSTQSYFYSRKFLFLTFTFFLAFGIFWRIIGVFALRLYRTLGYNNRNFVIYGHGDLSKQIKSYYNYSPELGFKFQGYFDNKLKESNSLLSLKKKIENKEIDVVYCCLPYLDQKEVEELIKFSETFPVEIKVLTDFRGFLQKGVKLEYHGYIPILSLSTKPYSDPKVELIKRSFDIIVSLFALIFFSPILFTVALITKISSKGPIFYRQERIGRWGIPFQIIKFRSMIVNAEKNGPALSSGAIDDRITNWGRFMRKTRLDELPQFFNVLLGQMSIVGPRPERQFFIDEILKDAPEYAKLLTLRPGITSIGQIKYGYASSVAEMIQRMKYDLLYLKKYSIETDLAIILLTAKVMFLAKGK